MDQTPGMVAVATFSDGRLREDGTVSYEWVRYACVRGVSVVGGMGRLLDAFVATVGDGTPVEVMTYADLEWYDGASYRKLGFRPCGLREPVMFRCIDGQRVCSRDDGKGVALLNLGSLKYVRSYWDTGCASRL